MTSTLYKVLGPDGEAIHGGDCQWSLPNGKPGKWMQSTKTVKCCQRGYHLVELWLLPEWLRADCTIYLADGRGKSDSDGTGKTAYSQARLVRQLHISAQDLRLFAADCGEHVLPIFLKVRPDDDRPRKAIEAARSYARGEIGAAAWAARDAQDAARDAQGAARDARDTAWAAARTAWAAWAAAWAAWTAWDARATWDAAWAAARAAARTAWHAAGDAAGDAERQWQAQRLTSYLTEVS